MTWILILTMWSADSKFMLSVTGFASESRCTQAAAIWTQQNGLSNGFHKNTAVCVAL
jgi:hypothetical protein